MKFIDFEYLIEADFECEEFLNKNYQNLINYYDNGKVEGFNDLGLVDTPINSFFNPKIEKIIHDTFIVEKHNWGATYNLYVQDNTNTKHNWHNHIHLASSICGVFYTQLPKEGGEFEVIHPPSFEIDQPLRFKPQLNKIYLFPSWLYHRATPQKDKEKRICINIAYPSYFRPIVKNFGYIW